MQKMLNSPSFNLKRKACFLSTYFPTKCGIATFTKDIVDNLGLAGEFAPSLIIAVRKRDGFECYKKTDELRIIKEEQGDYDQAATRVNASDIDLVSMQHEFGIFGGEWGNYVLSFLEKVKKPVITTLHTVQPDFEPEALRVLGEIVSHSKFVVVMGRTAASILVRYGFPSLKIRIIQHGCPDIPFVNREGVKSSLNLVGKTVLCTFGLLSRGKGIEYAIRALPFIIDKHPEVVYLVIGETHPEVKAFDDENYRRRLVNLMKELGLQNHVEFQNRFLARSELIKYLQATDVYITPYLGENQISSGTLTYALGAGRIVVSTPYLHAQEALAEGRGLFCEFRNPFSIAENVNKILDDKSLKRSMERKAYEYSRGFTWPKVVRKYAKLFEQATDKRNRVERIEPLVHPC
ncbi:glycosyltransferase family 4 protein [Candidatus Woesearchaeota archaeon]|nr:glycosyltransferase family 4 protein [Candidatus Woesearchaeota archaeon]